MKQRKRFLVLALTLCMALSTACAGGSGESSAGSSAAGSSSASAGEKVTLQFWGFQTGSEDEYLQKFIKEFNDTHNNIQVEYTKVNQEEYTTTAISTAYANGEAPDILFVEPATYLKYAEKGMLGDLKPYLSQKVQDDFLPSTLKSVTYNGKILGLPYEMELLGLFYNEDMLKAANVEVPKTWDELYSAAKKLTTNKVSGLILPVDKTSYTLFNFWPFLWMENGEVVSEDGTKSAFNSESSAKVLDFWAKFFKEGLSPSKLQIGPYDIGNIGNGTAAMQVSGTYVITAAETTYKDVNIKVAPLPTPDGKNQITVAGGQKLAINGMGSHQKEAAEFVTWLYGSDDISRVTEWCTKAKFSYPARKSVVEANKSEFEKGLRKTFTDEIYNTARPEPSYNSDTTDAVSECIQQVMFGGQSSSDALKTAEEKINNSLK